MESTQGNLAERYPPGPPLDSLIAETFFGRSIEAPYSSEIAYAWRLVEKLGWRVCIIKESDRYTYKYRFKAWFMKDLGEGYPVSSSKDSMAHAICLAALRTQEKE